jgi:adenylosuccinate lyase
MRQNLEMTQGLVFSGQLLLDLAARGVLREQAYSWVQRNAMQASESGASFRHLVEQDGDICKVLNEKDLDYSFSLERQLRHVDRIFERVFGLGP